MYANAVGRPMEILLVEDNLADARLAFEAFRLGKFKQRVTWLSDGAEAMEFLRQHGRYAKAPRPDLILLDLNLARLDGRELLARLKSDPALQKVPVVILTASRAHEDLIRGEELQVEGYLVKPIDLDKFLKLIRELKRFWHEDLMLPAV